MHLILSIAVIHLLACLSPGPDIFLVVRTSLRHGWRSGVATTAGILCGVALQITLGIAGISYLISQSRAIEAGIALAGATWLIYLGLLGLRSAPDHGESGISGDNGLSATQNLISSWRNGLLVNLLNPKALIFFLSLFSVMLGPEIPLPIRILAGATMITVQAVAFSTVAFLVDQPSFRAGWPRLQRWLDAAISLILLGIGLWIWISLLFFRTA